MRQFTETLGTLRMSLIDIAKVLQCKTSSHRDMGYVAGKPKVVAFQNKGADQPAQTRKLVSDFVVQSLESIIDELVTSKISAF